MPKIIIASGPVIVENNKVLLNQHGDDNFWKFCGGKVEDYEKNLISAAIREAKEEMGIELEILNPEPFITWTYKDLSDTRVDVLLAHYLAKRIGEIKPGPDILAWQWFDLDKLPDKLAPNILPVLKHFNFIK
jgi:8-oxo-dGTP pyrophosphatase MutT (NUDIX family)